MSVKSGREMLLSTVTEAQWQRQVIEWAHRAGWLVHHVHDSRKEEWGTDAGFPDLVLARDGVVLFVELKAEGGRISKAQARWWTAFGNDTCFYIWRPCNEEMVQHILGVRETRMELRSLE